MGHYSAYRMGLDNFKRKDHNKMPYRPRIPNEVHERVEKHTTGDRINENQLYINAILMFYNDTGKEYGWVDRIRQYCKSNELDEPEVLDKIICEVIDESGEPDIKFKEQLDL